MILGFQWLLTLNNQLYICHCGLREATMRMIFSVLLNFIHLKTPKMIEK